MSQKPLKSLMPRENSLWIKMDQSTLSNVLRSWRSMWLPGSDHTEVTANLTDVVSIDSGGKSHVGVGWTTRREGVKTWHHQEHGSSWSREMMWEMQEKYRLQGCFLFLRRKTLKYVDMSSSGLCDSEMYYYFPHWPDKKTDAEKG